MCDKSKPTEGTGEAESVARCDCHSLLGCPFCGESVDLKPKAQSRSQGGFFYTRDSWMKCQNCGARGPVTVVDGSEEIDHSEDEFKWNHRST